MDSGMISPAGDAGEKRQVPSATELPGPYELARAIEQAMQVASRREHERKRDKRRQQRASRRRNRR
jgi:hypothetical protein